MCDISHEHLAHDVVPVAEAAEEYKEQIEQERQLVITEFNSIRQFLEEQENFLLLKVMETLEKGMFWKKTKHAAIFFREVSTFDDLIQGLKEKCQQSAVELLQDVESTLKRCKNTLMNPVTLPPWMKLGVWDLFDFNAFLGTTMKQFKDTLASGYQIQKANVTLDPDTAHPKLILSEDLKSVWMGRSSQNLIKDDKRFDHMMCVLGREMFLGGRHYWDVVVENEGDWGVGVARISMKRKGVENFINMKGFWALTKWGHLCVYMNPPVFSPEQINWEIKRIRVSLNYPGRRVTFCDAERGNLLHAFAGTSFSGEPICPFFWLQRKTRLSICP
ncbi:zinc finger protein RFP-like [Protobothrops mucrosquamatus]|uniref:zinc finger protein RFP-like n=1 Tax=Protobothrops mucrosquamatus TaxID=103944 RepID=UPI0010FB160C|nr:zinc finger protein RFP-like [Protobothrops mucrosquamatus]